MRDDDDALIPPGEFISVAEKNGLILKLGEMVFESDTISNPIPCIICMAASMTYLALPFSKYAFVISLSNLTMPTGISTI